MHHGLPVEENGYDMGNQRCQKSERQRHMHDQPDFSPAFDPHILADTIDLLQTTKLQGINFLHGRRQFRGFLLQYIQHLTGFTG